MYMPRFLIASLQSSQGKTTLALGLSAMFLERNYRVAAFKCGPDYIDSTLLRLICDNCSNLDLFLSNKTQMLDVFCHKKKYNIAIIEGAMGLYDGIGYTQKASSYNIAKCTHTPIILTIDASKSSMSIIAMIRGALDFDMHSNLIRAVVLNCCNKKAFISLKPLIKKHCNIECIGYIPMDKSFTLETKHLGLCIPNNQDFLNKIQRIKDTFSATISFNALLKIAYDAIAIKPPSTSIFHKKRHIKIRIGVAKDEAFFFYYEENLQLLRQAGADIIPFSPMYDKELPFQVSGLYIGGGYPEEHWNTLLNNTTMCHAIQTKIQSKIPLIAECGGFLYLQKICAINGTPFLSKKGLVHFGYCTLRARKNNLFCKKGHTIKAHEFHYWDSTNNGNTFLAKNTKKDRWQCYQKLGNNAMAGFAHIYFVSKPKIVKNFVKKCQKFMQRGQYCIQEK